MPQFQATPFHDLKMQCAFRMLSVPAMSPSWSIHLRGKQRPGCHFRIDENAYRIGHVHIADYPGRHEPGPEPLTSTAFPMCSPNINSAAQSASNMCSKNTLDSARFLARWKARPETARLPKEFRMRR